MAERPGTMRKGFRHRGTCLTAAASGRDDAVQESRKRSPDANGDTLGCSSCYSEKKRERVMRPCICYSVWTEACSAKKLEGYDDLFLYVPEERQIIRIAEGNGDNLLEEDTDAGYVDYIYYDQYMLDVDMPDVDGGMVLLKEMLRDRYGCLADCIPDVLDMAYGSCLVSYTILG